MRTVTEFFDFSFRAAGKTDIGRRRSSNQDEAVLCPELGFFAVSDGMGGLANGKLAAEFVSKTAPGLMKISMDEYADHQDVNKAATAFVDSLRLMSNNLYEAGNADNRFTFGATFVGVWLVQNKAIFGCLGDSRGYMLPKYKKQLCQITEDQNMAAILVKNGELTESDAKYHPSSSRLTAFVGMPVPATPELYIMDVKPGDRLLLCSDGLFGMVEDDAIVCLLRSSKSPDRICDRLISRANQHGGRDNIAAVYIKIFP